eukprot:4574154-Prymnesium_polylepis.1
MLPFLSPPTHPSWARFTSSPPSRAPPPRAPPPWAGPAWPPSRAFRRARAGGHPPGCTPGVTRP